MLRDRQEKEQLVRKFEEILPFLRTQNNFGWIVPECGNDPVYKIFPDTTKTPTDFKKVVVNIKTGWHSEFIYRDDKGIHRIKEEVVSIQDDWAHYNNCYKSCCRPSVRLV